MIIPINIKSATIFKCRNGATRHPLVRALNIKFGFDPECQLVFRLYEDWNLRTETLKSRLAIAGPEDGQRWEAIVHIDEEYMPMLMAWRKGKRCRPFIYKLSVTEDIEERIKDHQKYFKNASYPVHVGQGFPQQTKQALCQTKSSKEKSQKKLKRLKLKSLVIEPHQSHSKPLNSKSSQPSVTESVSFKTKSLVIKPKSLKRKKKSRN